MGYIGHVGTLAAALGVGIAVATTPGVALAGPEPDGTTTQSDTASPNPGVSADIGDGNTPSGAPALAALPTANSAVATPVGTPDAAVPAAAQSAVGTPVTAAAIDGMTTSVDTQDATAVPGLPTTSVTQVGSGVDSKAGGVISTGGAQISGTVAEPVGATKLTGAAAITVTPPHNNSATMTDIVHRPNAQSLKGSTLTGSPAALSADVRSAPAPTTDPGMRPNRATLTASTSESVSSIAIVSPSPIPVAAISPRVGPVTALVSPVVSLVAGLVSQLGLAPWSTANPLVPVDTPVMWTLLAFVRRQFEQTLLNHSPKIGFGPITTSQSDIGLITGTIPTADPDGDPLGIGVLAKPANGTVAVDPTTGVFTYSPSAALAATGGTDTFSVGVVELNSADHLHELQGLIAPMLGDRGDAAVATVTVTVVPVTEHGLVDTAALRSLVASGNVELSQNKDGTVRVIDGTFTDVVVRNDADAAGLLNRVAGLFGAPAGFADEAHITHEVLGGGDVEIGAPTEVVYRLAPTVGGIPTLTSQVLLVTDEKGTVTSIFSSYNSKIAQVDTTPSNGVAGESDAVSAAVFAALSTAAVQPDPATINALLGSLTVESDLVIYDVDPDETPTLARRIKVFSPVTPTNPVPLVSSTYYIHANGTETGNIFAEISDLADADAPFVAVTASGINDLLGKPRTLNVDYQPSTGVYRYVDWPRLLGTFASASTSQVPGELVYGQVANSIDLSAVSAQSNTEVAYDYYRYILGRTSFDGAGKPVYITILPDTYNNAYYSSTQGLVFGHETEAALDVVAHEYTHGIVNYAVAGGTGLIYSGESGALNESYADIMGSLIEGKSGADKWLIGEDYGCGVASGCALRDLSRPSHFGDPENYANRYTGTADYGGVHTNSLIFSFAAYKMMTDPRTSTISSETWSRVFYNSLYRLPSNAKFTDGRAAVTSAAKALGFTTSQQLAVTDAFTAVGIL